MLLHPDRCFSQDPFSLDLARALYHKAQEFPILSPHGHTEASWFADDVQFGMPAELLIIPDHYILRMLYSQGISIKDLGRFSKGSQEKISAETDFEIWRIFCSHYYLFRGTPSRLWIDYVLSEVFGINEILNSDNAEKTYSIIKEKLVSKEFSACKLLKKFRIELISTTNGATEELLEYQKIKNANLESRIIPCFRPDSVVDPEHESFYEDLNKLSELTHEDCKSLKGYLNALQKRREFFKSVGATSTDHGHPKPLTLHLGRAELERLFLKVVKAPVDPQDAEMFRAAMLVEFAKMSLDDGLVMQLHCGSHRNHNLNLFHQFGRDVGADIPQQTEFTQSLKELLNIVGNDKRFHLIVFTLDESTYSRELAPLAGHYPCLFLGPPWWFHDSVEGMRRFRERVTETAGFYNTAGFNDDTRAFLSIPARHDLARRMDAVFLTSLVREHRLTENEAFEVIEFLSYRAVKKAYRL